MEHILDVGARAVARLAEQYRGTTTFPALLDALTSGHQDVEDALWSLVAAGLDDPESPNLLRKSSFENDGDGDGVPDGWAVRNDSASTEPVTATLPTGEAASGERFLHLTWSVSNTTSKGVYTSTSLGGGLPTGWSDNVWYTVSWWAKASGTVAGKLMCLRWDASPDDQVAIDNPPLSESWQRYAYRIRWTTSPLPGNGAGQLGELCVSVAYGVACAGALDLDAFQVEAGEQPTTYLLAESDQQRPHFDVIGRIVSQPRDGRGDDAYRVWLEARIRLNRSAGTGPDLIETLAALTGGAYKVTLFEQYPAAFALRLDGAPVQIADARALADVLRSAKAAGVRGVLEVANGTPEETFTLDVGPGLDVGKLADAYV